MIRKKKLTRRQTIDYAIVILCGFFLFSLAAPVYSRPGNVQISIEKINRQITECKNKIADIQLETIELEENIDWLELKILRLMNMEQPVSDSIQNSMHAKKSKIGALKKEKTNYLKYFKKLKNELDQLEQMAGHGLNQKTIASIKEQLIKDKMSEWVEFVWDSTRECYNLKTILPIFFTPGSAKISKDYTYFLKTLAQLIKAHKIQIIVDGYADIDPIHTRQYPSNFELGAIRAANVVHALVNYGVDPSAFKIASTGKYRFPDARPMSKQKAVERYVNITVSFSG